MLEIRGNGARAASAFTARPFCLHRATEFWVFRRRKNYLKWKTIPVETRTLFCVCVLPLPISGKWVNK